MDALVLARVRAQTPEICAILDRHFDVMRTQTPAESCHVMAPDALMQRGAILIAARDTDGSVLGVGALAEISPTYGELKSMHTLAQARGRGVGQAVLAELVAIARANGVSQLNLETGSADMFAPARALYARNGFASCPPVAEYRNDPASVFMTRRL